MRKIFSLFLVVPILCLTMNIACAGIVEDSPYEQRWEITVTNCQGQTTIYYDCIITNQGEYVVTFIPNAGKIMSSNYRTVKIMRNLCTGITMQQQ